MEEKVINILLGIKAGIGEPKQGQSRLEGRMGNLESNVSEIKANVSELNERVGRLEEDMSEVKGTVNTLADGFLGTSREVKQIKGKAAHLISVLALRDLCLLGTSARMSRRLGLRGGFASGRREGGGNVVRRFKVAHPRMACAIRPTRPGQLKSMDMPFIYSS